MLRRYPVLRAANKATGGYSLVTMRSPWKDPRAAIKVWHIACDGSLHDGAGGDGASGGRVPTHGWLRTRASLAINDAYFLTVSLFTQMNGEAVAADLAVD